MSAKPVALAVSKKNLTALLAKSNLTREEKGSALAALTNGGLEELAEVCTAHVHAACTVGTSWRVCARG